MSAAALFLASLPFVLIAAVVEILAYLKRGKP